MYTFVYDIRDFYPICSHNLDKRFDRPVGYKHLGSRFRKGRSRLRCLSRLRFFDLCTLYQTVVASALFLEHNTIQQVAEAGMLSKPDLVINNDFHLLHAVKLFWQSAFSHRLIPPKCQTECFRKSFLPAAIRLFNTQWLFSPRAYFTLWCVLSIYSSIHLRQRQLESLEPASPYEHTGIYCFQWTYLTCNLRRQYTALVATETW